MKKAFLLLLFLCALAGTAVAQEGNTTTIRFPGAPTGACAPLSFGINSATGDLYDCVAGVWTKVGSAGGGGSPGGATSTIQFNAGGGTFGGVTNLIDGEAANCDNAMTNCAMYFTSTGNPFYFLAGTNSSAPAGNRFFCEQDTDAGVYCTSDNGTDHTNFSFAPGDANSGMAIVHAGLQTGYALSDTDRDTRSSRIIFWNTYAKNATTMLFAPGAGWGSTATASASSGSDNAFSVTITTGGSGIAANPTVTYTYADGDFSTGGGGAPTYVCGQAGGNDVLADVTNTAGQTSVVLTWHGTPTTGKTYTLNCVGFQWN